jgi:hypothetical protein
VNVGDPAVVDRVVGRQVGAAGDAEHGVDAFGFQAFDDGVDGAH